MIETLQKITLDDLAVDLATKLKIAEKRSGERGLQARTDLLDAEKKLATERKKTMAELEQRYPGDSTVHIEELISKVTEELEMMEIDTAESRAREILLGMSKKIFLIFLIRLIVILVLLVILIIKFRQRYCRIF